MSNADTKADLPRADHEDVAPLSSSEAVRESERSGRPAIDRIPGLVAFMAPNGEIETLNRQILEYFGLSQEELNDWETNGVVHPEDLPHVVEAFKSALISGIPYHFDLRLRRSDGEFRSFLSRGVPERDESGRIVRWCVLFTDIEDRTRALAQLEPSIVRLLTRRRANSGRGRVT